MALGSKQPPALRRYLAQVERIACFLLAFAILVEGSAQLVINEASSQNARTIIDPSGEYHDWVELHNAGTSTIALGTYFLSDDFDLPNAWTLPAMDLEPGGYVVFFHGDENPDGLRFPFKLSGDGESLILSDGDLQAVDVMDLPALQVDHSAGRSDDDGTSFFPVPTPGGPNHTTAYPGYAPTPTFGAPPGHYNAPIDVPINGCSTCSLFYTLGGHDPDQNSMAYNGAVVMGQTFTMKAIAYREGYLPSSIRAGTYLINEPTALPVIALSMHPDSMFHEVHGLYMLGPEADTVYPHWGANFWDERGIAVRFEYFDEGGTKRSEQDVELRIHGGRASRNRPQRPLRLTARGHFGDDRIRYGFFPEKPELQEFKRLILRNSGGDWCQAHYRDGFYHQVALHAGLNIDVLAFKPCVVYINGRYWGIHNIRERVDVDYLGSNNNVEESDILLMDEENHVIQGDSLHFDSLQRFIRTHDMADDEHFAHVDSLMDLPSFVDYFALEMFAGNSDWPTNNLKFWKPSVHTGKWRYLMYDMDAAMAPAPWLPNDFDMFYWLNVHREGSIHAEIYQSLMERPEFRRGFLNRLADLMNTCLSAPELLRENDRIRNTIGAEIPRHFQRWWNDVSIWHEQSGEVIPQWIMERCGHMRDDVLEWHALPNTAELRFEMFPPEAGTMRVNTITPPLPFQGVYFNGNAIDVSVEADAGFTFSHWTYSAAPDSSFKDTHLRRSFATDGDLVAHFAKSDASFYALPNPASTHCDLSYTAPEAGPVEVSLWDAQGRSIERWNTSVTKGVNRIPVDLSALSAGVYHVRLAQDDTTQAIRLVRF